MQPAVRVRIRRDMRKAACFDRDIRSPREREQVVEPAERLLVLGNGIGLVGLMPRRPRPLGCAGRLDADLRIDDQHGTTPLVRGS